MNAFVELQNLSVSYPIHGGLLGRKIGEIKAVNDVSFSIRRGETLGLVGESGCGKSTLGKALLRLTTSTQGKILFDGTDLIQTQGEDLRKVRKRIQMIFQDPYSSLNPRMKIGAILSEPLEIHNLCAARDRKEKVLSILKTVGLRPESYEKYPHEFSGGQRQRIGIARALSVQPDFIVADEPVSALDVSIQAQILNLLKDLQKEFNLTYLFVSHDLNVVRYFCDRIVVMYLGRIMEVLTQDQLADTSFKKHPYTEALLASAPKKHPDQKRPNSPLQGDIPSPKNPPSGCVFHPRCPEFISICSTTLPALTQKSSLVACHCR
jgi:peptide/nickel transport system ATP-binding protein/oligopeptide transport system ATP-binding protein